MHRLLPFRSYPPTAPMVAAIGFFDGVHRGHRYLLDQVIATARQQHGAALAVTFANHPRHLLDADYHPALLTTADEKLERLAAAGIDACVVLDFDRATAALTAADFMRYLHDDLGVVTLIMGYDHHFGSDHLAFAEYVAAGRANGLTVVRAAAYATEEFTVSSSTVRRLLEVGQVERARQCLGYPYALSGRVVEGQKLGRRLGYPTANLRPTADKMVPGRGVYAVDARVDGVPYAAMLNIGCRPTVDDGRGATIEAHLFDFNGDLYGRDMQVNFLHRLRDEQHFDTLEALQQQLANDARRARALLAADTAHGGHTA